MTRTLVVEVPDVAAFPALLPIDILVAQGVRPFQVVVGA
jgi:hypothetical protein